MLTSEKYHKPIEEREHWYVPSHCLLCCLLGPLLCIVSLRCYVFCLLVVLAKLSIYTCQVIGYDSSEEA